MAVSFAYTITTDGTAILTLTTPEGRKADIVHLIEGDEDGGPWSGCEGMLEVLEGEPITHVTLQVRISEDTEGEFITLDYKKEPGHHVLNYADILSDEEKVRERGEDWMDDDFDVVLSDTELAELKVEFVKFMNAFWLQNMIPRLDALIA